jgi:hypothetical protein
VLVVALGGVAALSAIAIAVAVLASVEAGIGAAERARVEVFAAAESALEAAAASLGAEPDWTVVLGEGRRSLVLESQPAPQVVGWGVLDLDARTRALQGVTDRDSVWDANRPIWRLYVDGSPSARAGLAPDPVGTYAAVWLADDEGETDGAPLVDSNGLLNLRAEAYAPGRATTTVEAVVRRTPAGAEVLSWRVPDPSG